MFGSSLDDYLHLLVPPVVKLFDSSDIPLTVRRLVNKEFKVIPQYCIAHPVLRIITRNKI